MSEIKSMPHTVLCIRVNSKLVHSQFVSESEHQGPWEEIALCLTMYRIFSPEICAKAYLDNELITN